MSTEGWIFMIGFRVLDVGLLVVWLVWFFRLRDDDDSDGGGGGPGGGGAAPERGGGPGGGRARAGAARRAGRRRRPRAAPRQLAHCRPPTARPRQAAPPRTPPRRRANTSALTVAHQAPGNALAGAPPGLASPQRGPEAAKTEETKDAGSTAYVITPR